MKTLVRLIAIGTLLTAGMTAGAAFAQTAPQTQTQPPPAADTAAQKATLKPAQPAAKTSAADQNGQTRTVPASRHTHARF